MYKIRRFELVQIVCLTIEYLWKIDSILFQFKGDSTTRNQPKETTWVKGQYTDE